VRDAKSTLIFAPAMDTERAMAVIWGVTALEQGMAAICGVLVRAMAPEHAGTNSIKRGVGLCSTPNQFTLVARPRGFFSQHELLDKQICCAYYRISTINDNKG
jgi:hypothetical protein